MMARLLFFIFWLILLINFSCLASSPRIKKDSSFTLSGIVFDGETGNPLGSVTVRAANIDIGKFSDKDGKFKLKLPQGKYTILFSMVGKKTEIAEIKLDSNIDNFKVTLAVNPLLTGDVVVIAETAAERLMRKTIERKISYKDSVKSYKYLLYTKFVASADTTFAGRKDNATDTTILSIFESYSNGYYQSPDLYYNEIIQRRQSVNVPAQANFVAFGTNINSFDDYVKIFSEEITTPFHKNALDYYEFNLDAKFDDLEDKSIARIIATPKSNNRKQFQGFVLLDTVKLVPVSVELTPNKAVQLPFDALLFFKQTFDLVNNIFVTPSYLNIYASVDAGFLWIIKPRVDIKIETYAYNYVLNEEIPSKYFNRRRIDASKTADDFDSLYWKKNEVVPLSKEELYAYGAIARARENPDSSMTEGFFGTYFAPVSRQLAKLARPPFTGWSDIFEYNKIHGAYLGIGLKGDITDYNEAYAKIGYGFADKRPYGSLEIKQFFEEERIFALTTEVFYNLRRSDNPLIFRSDAITLTSILFHNDYGDYYYGKGFKVGFEAGLGQLRFIRQYIYQRPNTLKIYILHEDQRKAILNSEFSIFNRSMNFRTNPDVIEGTENSIGFELNYKFSQERRLSNFGFGIQGLISEPSVLPSNFTYKRFSIRLNFRTQTLPLWRLDCRINGGFSVGKLPPQRYFSLESSVSGIGTMNSFQGLKVKEFYGDRFAAFAFEHNFGEIVPGVFRIPNIASFGLEFLLFGNFGYSIFTDNTLFSPIDGILMKQRQTAATSDKFYYEAGFGINQILIFLRFDISARFTQTDTPKFFFTLGAASY